MMGITVLMMILGVSAVLFSLAVLFYSVVFNKSSDDDVR